MPEIRHVDVVRVAFGWYAGRQVAVSVGKEGTLRMWSLPALTPIGNPVKADPSTYVFHAEGLTVEKEELPSVINLAGRATKVFIETGGDEYIAPPLSATYADLASGKDVDYLEGSFYHVRAAVVGGRTVLVTANGSPQEAEGPPAGSLSLWDPVTHRQLGMMRAEGVPDYDYGDVGLAMGKLDGKPVALVGGGDNALRLWDLSSRKLLAAVEPEGHRAQIRRLALTTWNGRPTVATRSADGVVMLWDLATRRRIETGNPPADIAPGGLAYDGTARPYEEGDDVQLRSVATGATVGAVIPVNRRFSLLRMRFTEIDGRRVALHISRNIRIWDLASGRRLGTIPKVNSIEGDVAIAEFRCTTAILAVSNKTLNVWDLRTGHRLTRRLPHPSRILDVEYATLGDLPIAVTATDDGNVRVWNLLNGSQIGTPQPLGGRLAELTIAYANGHTLAIRAGRERLWLWDLSKTP
ncbi:WD40 repeat domain-containing protein [Streptosporangium sp. NPDC001681]|uniref:WD40 repeat domain-containing protein n=1 Tax=Streptosporangium sp. NPDC001681 TaxID=3154395 RepID=UPI00332258BB